MSYELQARERSRATEDPLQYMIPSARPGEALAAEQAKLAVESVWRSLGPIGSILDGVAPR